MGRLFAPKKPVEAAPVVPVVAASPSSGMSKDEVSTLVNAAVGGVAETLRGTISALTEQVTQLAGRQPQVVVQAPVATPADAQGISDHDIDQAVLSGQGAAARIRQMVDAAVTRATDRVIKERVIPLENFGVQAIGNLTAASLASRPLYGRFKKEIDAHIGALEPGARANASVLEVIYNSVVGQHTEELTREATEAAVRQAQGGGGVEGVAAASKAGSAAPGTGAGSGKRDTPTIPTPQELGGQDATNALAHKGSGGQSQDDFARGMGYADWKTYITDHEALMKEMGDA